LKILEKKRGHVLTEDKVACLFCKTKPKQNHPANAPQKKKKSRFPAKDCSMCVEESVFEILTGYFAH
jgi:hypothetical protein